MNTLRTDMSVVCLLPGGGHWHLCRNQWVIGKSGALPGQFMVVKGLC